MDALSRNPVGKAADDDDFSEEVQDIGTKQDESVEMTGGVFSIRHGEESEWFGLRRHSGGPTKHHRCCFDINHWRWSEAHQLFMLDALAEASQDEEDDSFEEDVEATDSEEVRNSGFPKDKRVLTRKPKYYSGQQQLELVLAAQELLKYGEHDEGDAKFDKQEACDVDAESMDIWEDEVYLELLKGGVIPDTADLQAGKRTRKRATDYCWKDDKLYFKGLYVPKPKERIKLVSQMHEDLGHFGEQRTLTEICQRYYWNN